MEINYHDEVGEKRVIFSKDFHSKDEMNAFVAGKGYLILSIETVFQPNGATFLRLWYQDLGRARI